MNPRLSLPLFVVLAVSAASASASISTYQDASTLSGAQTDNITVDSATGLEWLDWDATMGRSYNNVLSSLSDSSNALFGWRFATSAEVEQLFDHLGLPTSSWPSFSFIVDDGAAAQNAAQTIGAFNESNLFAQTYGITSDAYSSTAQNAALYAVQTRSGSTTRESYSWVTPVSASSTSTNVGSALVRTSDTGVVPEPASLAVWSGIAALAGFGVWRKRSAA